MGCWYIKIKFKSLIFSFLKKIFIHYRRGDNLILEFIKKAKYKEKFRPLMTLIIINEEEMNENKLEQN